MQWFGKSTLTRKGGFQYRKRYGLHAIERILQKKIMRIGFNTASGMDCMQCLRTRKKKRIVMFQYRKRYGLHAILSFEAGQIFEKVSIPQAVWIACNDKYFSTSPINVRVSIPQAVWIACNWTRCRTKPETTVVSIPQAVWIACNDKLFAYRGDTIGFNTASGMDCMQYVDFDAPILFTSRFNTASGMDCMQLRYSGCSGRAICQFQYRKRYGLHAIPRRPPHRY